MKLLNRILMDLVLLLILVVLAVFMPSYLGLPGEFFLISTPAAFALYVYINRKWPPYE